MMDVRYKETKLIKEICIFVAKSLIHTTGKKEKDLTLSYDTSPFTDRKSKEQRDNTKTPPKLGLHNDCGPT